MKKNSGLTLVEVVVALAVFMIVVAMPFPILAQSGLINVNSKEKLDAQEIGILVVEELLVVSESQTNESTLISYLDNTGLPSFGQPFMCDSIVCTINKDNYTVTLLFNNIDTSNLVKVSVNVDNMKYETLEWLIYD